MAKIVRPSDLAARLTAGEDPAGLFLGGNGERLGRLVASYGDVGVDDTVTAEDRSISFAISTGGVKRDALDIAPTGWKIDAYAKNPVVLWAHDDDTPAIGRAINTRIVGGVLRSTGIFATRDIHPLADTVYQLLKQRFLNAVSVGFQPLRARLASDPSRPGGVDVLEQELWEWSVVNVPVDPEALATARSVGIDTGPVFRWAEKLLDSGDMIVVPRAELETLRRMARMPTAPAVKTPKTPPVPVKRSLWHVSDLASLLYSLGWLQDNITVEAEIEGDDSSVPAQMLAALKALGQVLLDMTAEEVAEFLNRGDDEEIAVVVGDVVTYAADKPALRAMSVLSAIAGQARSATGVRYVVEGDEDLDEAAARRIVAQIENWKRTPGAPLVLRKGFKLRIYDPPTPAPAPAAEAAAGGDNPVETPAADEATLRRGRKARAARAAAAASLLKHT